MELPSAEAAREQMTILREAAKDNPQGTCYENDMELSLCEPNLNCGMAELVSNIDYHISTLASFGSELLGIPVE